MEKQVAPEQLQLQARDINAAIAPFRVAPYLQGDEYGPDEWRFRLYAPTREVLTDYLYPQHCDRHTLMLMVNSARKWGDLQYKVGKEHAVNKIAEHFKEIVK